MKPIESEILTQAMRNALDNARQFLNDSKTLQESGSIGHAASLAILGFEEAQKAYFLGNFHPCFDKIHTPEARDEMKRELRDHMWKQVYAKELLIGLEWLVSAKTSEFENLPSLTELQAGTEFSLDAKLNMLKNDGFYTNPFSNPPWNPTMMDSKKLDEAQRLLNTHISSVDGIVEYFSILHTFSEDAVIQTETLLQTVFNVLQEFDGVQITQDSIDEMREKLKEFGEIGEMLFVLVLAYHADPRQEIIERERKKLMKRKRP